MNTFVYESVYEARLRNLRMALGFLAGGSQTALAAKTGIAQSLISRMVLGRKNIGSKIARRFEVALGLPTNCLDCTRRPEA